MTLEWYELVSAFLSLSLSTALLGFFNFCFLITVYFREFGTNLSELCLNNLFATGFFSDGKAVLFVIRLIYGGVMCNENGTCLSLHLSCFRHKN